MVNDIRPEASALLRQITNMSQRNTALTSTQADKLTSTQADKLTSMVQANKLEKNGISVVEKVFNQIYSSSGFLEEEEVAPVKVTPLGAQLDVYA
ncbi:MAG: hypothetical protein ACUZ77_02570 [Candidatus Brocadiales bacterium]